MADTSTYSYDPLGGYATNPGPQQGSGAYGSVPGAVQIPPNIYSQLGSIDPNLADQTGTMNTTILNELQGQLSPETIASIQQNAAQFGATSGMPSSQFAGNYGLMNLGQSVEKQQQQGESDYLNMLKGTGATLTPQQLAAEIASNNATMAAAPNPTAAANQQMSDWQSKFQAAAGGGAGGVRASNPAGGGGTPMGGSTSSGGNFAGGGSIDNNVPMLPSGQVDYSQPFTYNTPTGSTLQWTGQDWTDLFGNPYASTTTTQGEYPANTYYDPNTDTSNYDYGVPQWNTQSSDIWAGDISDPNSAWWDNSTTDTSNVGDLTGDWWTP